MTADGLKRALYGISYNVPMYLYRLEHTPTKVAAILEEQARLAADKEAQEADRKETEP